MSRRNIPAHQLRRHILSALQHGAANSSTRETAITSAASYLRGQGIRAKPEEIGEVLALTVHGVLFPPCDCMPMGMPPSDEIAPALFTINPERDVPGPHHRVQCPMWRAVRP